MKHRCPKCGHRWQEKGTLQSKAAKARWAGLTKAQRRAAMQRVRGGNVKDQPRGGK